MKTGWQIKSLGDIADVKGGKRVPKGSKLQSQPTNHPYITVSDFTDDGTIDTSDLRYVSSEVFEQIKRYTISSNDLYLSIAGTIGKTGYVPIELNGASLTENACKLVLRPGIDRDFVYYFTKSDEFTTQAGSNTRTAAQPKLALERLKTIKLPIPASLPEQQRIVGLLDEAFAGVAAAKANVEKNLRNARALFESHLQSVLTERGKGWVEKTLESCCEQLFAGGDVPKDRLSQERTPKYSVPIFSNGEKDDGLYGFTDVARVTNPSITVSARGTLGFTAIRTEPFLPVVRLIVLVPNEKLIMLSFLYYAVVGMDFGNTGTSIPQLTVPNFRESMLHVPSLSEQKAIVEKLDALREQTQRLATLYERKLAALEALKKSLLHQAFTGHL
jgi:type I restriction enzyme, S subunit